jgi:hypothetical protein
LLSCASRAGPSILDVGAAAFTGNGSAAIQLALQAGGVTIGDRVLVPTYHCRSMIGPVAALGADPTFYPIDERGCPRLDAIESALARASRPRAVLAAHFFGIPIDLRPLRQLCDQHEVVLVEDCAQTFFGAVDGRPVGSSGHYAIASLAKFFPTLQGGLFTAARDLSIPVLRPVGLAKELYCLFKAFEVGNRYRCFGRADGALDALFALKRYLRGQASSNGALPDDPERVGFPKGLDSNAGIEATWVARWLLARADQVQIADRRRANYRWLAAALRSRVGLEPAVPLGGADQVPCVLPVRFAEPEVAYRRLRLSKIPVMRWDQRWPGTPVLAGDAGSGWSHDLIQLPCHQQLGPDALELVVEAVASATRN